MKSLIKKSLKRSLKSIFLFMENTENERNSSNSLLENVKDYVGLQIDLLKVNVIEKMTKLFYLFFLLLFGTLIILVAFIYLSVAFMHWMEALFNSMIPGALIMGGVTLLIFLLFYLFRKKILLNPLTRKIVAIVFDHEKEEEE